MENSIRENVYKPLWPIRSLHEPEENMEHSDTVDVPASSDPFS
jgi:hypothetical protein